jgi:hypothetical protein
MAVFWVVEPRSLVEVYQCFRGPCCLHHQGDSSRYNPEDRHLPAIYIHTEGMGNILTNIFETN